MIVFSRGEVKGLTTGAGMWLAGAVGLSVGLGYWFVAAFATFACFVVLFILGKIEIGSEESGSQKDGSKEKRD
jgi:putative Mg2+ transporter-C (MgtC) family protein